MLANFLMNSIIYSMYHSEFQHPLVKATTIPSLFGLPHLEMSFGPEDES